MRVNIKELAREAGVSVATVSRVLNNSPLVSEKLRSKVMQVIERFNYIPHASARSLSTNKTDTIGVILPDMYGEFFSELIKGLDSTAREYHHHILLSSTHGLIDDAEYMIRSMYGKVDGLIMVLPEIDTGIVGKLVQNLPTVWVNHSAADESSVSISTDNYRSAWVVTEHLCDTGRKNIAFIKGPARNDEANERLNGFLAALKVRNMSPAIILDGDFTEHSGYVAVQKLLTQKQQTVDAIFAANDMMALGGLFALTERDIQVPEKIALAGFDDIPLARYAYPPLTTIKIDAFEMGRRAIELLIQQINGQLINGYREIIRPELIMRESTRVV